jgi:hypothetical protein
MNHHQTITLNELIDHYQLTAHPEGGYYKRSYESSEMISKDSLPGRFKGDRLISTAIYYLLPKGQRSKLHRIKSDETWHFYLGGPLRIVGINESGIPYEVTLGSNILAGEHLQYTVPANHWFGSKPCQNTEFSFVGCTVAPGFDFEDFEIGNKQQLLHLFPNAKELIDEFLD